MKLPIIQLLIVLQLCQNVFGGHKSLTFLLKVLLFSKKLLSLWPVSIKVVRNPLKKVVCMANIHKLALKGGM